MRPGIIFLNFIFFVQYQMTNTKPKGPSMTFPSPAFLNHLKFAISQFEETHQYRIYIPSNKDLHYIHFSVKGVGLFAGGIYHGEIHVPDSFPI